MKQRSYWFKRRRYGYGVVPTTWQGLVVTLVFIGLVIGGSFFLTTIGRNNIVLGSVFYLIYALVCIGALFVVIVKKSPPLKWRWGRKVHDNPEEDF